MNKAPKLDNDVLRWLPGAPGSSWYTLPVPKVCRGGLERLRLLPELRQRCQGVGSRMLAAAQPLPGVIGLYNTLVDL